MSEQYTDTAGTPLDDEALHDLFDQELDGAWGPVDVLNQEYQTSQALKLLDPVAYRCEFANWLDEQLTDGYIQDWSNAVYLVVFMQGDDAAHALDIYDTYGIDALIDHLKQWDGNDTRTAAIANGDVYATAPTFRGAHELGTHGYALVMNLRVPTVAFYAPLESGGEA